jgi:hypothetical protein
MEKQIAHLGFIQIIIERMARCSFLLRGWAVTLVSAIFALAAKDANTNFLLIAYFPVIAFWVLDGYYLYQERLYRELYKEVTSTGEAEINFSLDATKYKGKFFSKTISKTWVGGIFSATNFFFYGMLVVVLLFVIYVVIPAIGL